MVSSRAQVKYHYTLRKHKDRDEDRQGAVIIGTWPLEVKSYPEDNIDAYYN